MTLPLAIISGMTAARVIGRDNTLPWHISEDLQNFKQLTIGKTVIMGLNTFNSIGGALPQRNNIVLAAKPIKLAGVDVVSSIDEALVKAASYKVEVFIIGGASIYEQMLPKVNTMYLSLIKHDYPGNVYFPAYDVNEWQKVAEKDFAEFTFVTLHRRKQMSV